MSDVLQPGVPATPPADPVTPAAASLPTAAPSPAPAAAPQYDPEYVAQLERYALQAQQQFAALEPYQDDVRRLVEDSEFRNFYRDSSRAYEQFRKQSEPQIDPQLAAVRDELKAEFRPLIEDHQTRRQREEAQARADHQKFMDEQFAYRNRLIAERPDLGPDGINEIAAYADTLARLNNRNVSLEEAYKKMQSRGAAPPAAPPPSLRAEHGAPGIPAATPPSDLESWRKDFHGTLTARLRAGKAG